MDAARVGSSRAPEPSRPSPSDLDSAGRGLLFEGLALAGAALARLHLGKPLLTSGVLGIYECPAQGACLGDDQGKPPAGLSSMHQADSTHDCNRRQDCADPQPPPRAPGVALHYHSLKVNSVRRLVLGHRDDALGCPWEHVFIASQEIGMGKRAGERHRTRSQRDCTGRIILRVQVRRLPTYCPQALAFGSRGLLILGPTPHALPQKRPQRGLT